MACPTDQSRAGPAPRGESARQGAGSDHGTCGPRWESHAQKKRRSIGRTGFSIEYLEAVDFSGAVIDGGHVRLLEEVYACGPSGRGYPFRWSPTLKIEIAVDN